ncbi:MAG: hypothetical protein DRI98_12045, partial [Bacteroidetes bacterium]
MSSYTVPGGILEANQVYNYRVYAYREAAPDEDIDNYSMDQMWPSERNHFTTGVPVGDLPVAADDDFIVDEGSLTTLGLAANDSDVDGDLDLASIVIISGPVNGSISSVNPNGSVDYTHDGSETIGDSFTYTIKDLADNTSNIATVALTINLQNDTPVVSDIPDETIAEGETFATINLDDYVSDEEDIDADIDWTYSGDVELTVDITDRVATITIPDVDWFGIETITFTATDSGLLFAEDDATFDVLEVNDPPVALADSFTVLEGATDTLDLADNDYDVDDGLDLTSIAIVTEPTYGSIFINGDGTVDYTHDGSETTTDSFTYTIDDNAGITSNVVTVNLTITPQDDPAVISGDTIYDGNEGDAVGGDLNATDPDGLTDGTYFSVTVQATYGAADINADTGFWTFTPTDINWFGPDS